MKIGGKRQIGELQLSELITALLISEISAAPITNPTTPLLHAVIPVLSVILLEITLTFLTTKSRRLKRFLDGTPDIIIAQGKLDIDHAVFQNGRFLRFVQTKIPDFDNLIGETSAGGVYVDH